MLCVQRSDFADAADGPWAEGLRREETGRRQQETEGERDVGTQGL